MQLSVEVKREDGEILYFCRGYLVQGQATDYLFDLLTRSGCENVILDLEGIREFDLVGLQTLGLALAFLNGCNCRLAFQHAPPTLIEHLRRNYVDPPHIPASTEPGSVESSASSSRQHLPEPSVISTI